MTIIPGSHLRLMYDKGGVYDTVFSYLNQARIRRENLHKAKDIRVPQGAAARLTRIIYSL